MYRAEVFRANEKVRVISVFQKPVVVVCRLKVSGGNDEIRGPNHRPLDYTGVGNCKRRSLSLEDGVVLSVIKIVYEPVGYAIWHIDFRQGISDSICPDGVESLCVVDRND